MMTLPTEWNVIIHSCSLNHQPLIVVYHDFPWCFPFFYGFPILIFLWWESHNPFHGSSHHQAVFLEFNSSFPIVSLSSILRAWKNEHGRVLLVGSFHHDGLTVPGLRFLLEWARLPQKHRGTPSIGWLMHVYTGKSEKKTSINMYKGGFPYDIGGMLYPKIKETPLWWELGVPPFQETSTCVSPFVEWLPSLDTLRCQWTILSWAAYFAMQRFG